MEALILISPVFWASGAQAISDLNHAVVVIKADTMLASPSEKETF